MEKEESAPIQPEVQNSEPHILVEPALFSAHTEEKIETFSEPHTEVHETKKPRRKHSEQTDVKKDK